MMQNTILRWFAANQRPLPWRVDYEPYHVWISEIMLQQTQMERGVAYFERWVRRFPHVHALAEAHEEEVLKHWEGLGYYNRARNLHKAARVIVNEYGGIFPDTPEAVRALPGVGPYTTAAILSLAFEQDVPVVDANVERVFARVFDVDAPVKEKHAKTRIHTLAHELLPKGKARAFNQALMEFGALVCSKKPKCHACPISASCESFRLNIVNHRPVPGKSQDIIPINVVTGVLLHQGRIFIQKRPPGGVWPSLWEFPGGKIEPNEEPEYAVVREFNEELEFTIRVGKKLSIIKHGYTKFRVRLHCFLCSLENTGPRSGLPAPTLHAATEYRWATLDELDNYAFPAGHRKLIDMMRGETTLLSGQ